MEVDYGEASPLPSPNFQPTPEPGEVDEEKSAPKGTTTKSPAKGESNIQKAPLETKAPLIRKSREETALELLRSPAKRERRTPSPFPETAPSISGKSMCTQHIRRGYYSSPTSGEPDENDRVFRARFKDWIVERGRDPRQLSLIQQISLLEVFKNLWRSNSIETSLAKYRARQARVIQYREKAHSASLEGEDSDLAIFGGAAGKAPTIVGNLKIPARRQGRLHGASAPVPKCQSSVGNPATELDILSSHQDDDVDPEYDQRESAYLPPSQSTVGELESRLTKLEGLHNQLADDYDYLRDKYRSLASEFDSRLLSLEESRRDWDPYMKCKYLALHDTSLIDGTILASIVRQEGLLRRLLGDDSSARLSANVDRSESLNEEDKPPSKASDTQHKM